ncbi:hypothetical protein LCGC14_0380770 [marine sediment metagenome]|uniref:Uncharacterized protein n=1 Tax=marine sediment metagenome TaxID=412755 RepID=A0A0F9VPR6_9ZZZZ
MCETRKEFETRYGLSRIITTGNPTQKSIAAELNVAVVQMYAPKSTWWNRNHNGRAEWYYICKIRKGWVN